MSPDEIRQLLNRARQAQDLPPAPQHPPREHAPRVMQGGTLPQALIDMAIRTGEEQAQLARRLQVSQERRS